MKTFQLSSNPRKIYENMLTDIYSAKKSVCLETYLFYPDSVGIKFRNILIEKARQGLDIRILVDSWGARKAGLHKSFFSKLEKAGGKIKFFINLRSFFRLLGYNHEINHRKLLVIDNKITYLGSINFGAVFLKWREISLKIEGEIVNTFSKSFNLHWDLAGKISKEKIKSSAYKGFEIIQDIPADLKEITLTRYQKIIRSAKKEILIETPYFVPPVRIRRELAGAVKRGVKVKILLPNVSNVKLIDVVRNRYLSYLYRHGINLFFYLPKNLHSKLIIVDQKFFILGSSNLDYRSFRHQYEINLLGKDKNIIHELVLYFNSGLKDSKKFNYLEWKQRSSFRKIMELLLKNFEEYL